MEKIPPEILSRILGFVDLHSHEQAMACMCVNEIWLTATMRIKYKKILLGSLNKMEGFAARIVHGSLVRRSGREPFPIGHFVRRLDLPGDDEYTITDDQVTTEEWEISELAVFTSSLHIILVNTPFLQYFENDLVGLSVSSKVAQVATLSNMCVNTLSGLDLAIIEDDDGIFPAINALISLKRLVLRFDCDSLSREIFRPGPRWKHPIKFPLRVPTVTKMTWRIRNKPTKYMLKFMSTCRYGHCCDLSLQLDLRTLDPSLILPMFTENQFMKISWEGIATSAQAILAPGLVRATSLDIGEWAPAPELATQPEIPQIIKTTYCTPNDHHSGRPGSDDGFWCFIHALEARQLPVPRLCTININNERYSDDKRVGSYDAFVDRLSPIARRLWEKNIRITDSHHIDGFASA